jgi:hypothetical protein
MAIDQNGHAFHDLGPHPRQALCARLGRRHADKMYIDGKDGKTYHIGYIIGGLWLTLYEVRPWRRSEG